MIFALFAFQKFPFNISLIFAAMKVNLSLTIQWHFLALFVFAFATYILANHDFTLGSE